MGGARLGNGQLSTMQVPDAGDELWGPHGQGSRDRLRKA